MLNLFLLSISNFEVETRTQRLKDFGAPKKEQIGTLKPPLDQRIFLDTGNLSNFVSLDMIEN